MLELSDIARMCEQFTMKSGIIVTEGAMRQMAMLINSVQLDPHERWVVHSRQLDGHFQYWRERLPDLIAQVARDHQLKNRITTMDVVVWTARHLDGVWPISCPWGKPDEFPGVANIDKGIMDRQRNTEPTGA